MVVDGISGHISGSIYPVIAGKISQNWFLERNGMEIVTETCTMTSAWWWNDLNEYRNVCATFKDLFKY